MNRNKKQDKKQDKKFENKILTICLVAAMCIFATPVQADETKSGPRVEISLLPRSGTFMEGSTFDVPIFINTNGASIKYVTVKINFDKNLLQVIRPSGGTSIITDWSESPKYDNTNGTASYVGSIPEGIVTGSGLVATITFKATGYGQARVGISTGSEVRLNDGLDTATNLDLGRGEYTLIKKISEGVRVYSETHPIEGKWYNNNSPILSWDKEASVSGFSFLMDNKPSTIPDNTVDTTDTTQDFGKLSDGLWYFHIKALKNGAWGNTGHYLLKIDTAPPAAFAPSVENFLLNTTGSDRALVTFSTSDNLSGVDHYEIGTINENDPTTADPVFIQTEAPYQVPLEDKGTVKVIVRAVDQAGNVRDGYVEVAAFLPVFKFLHNNILFLAIIAILIIFAIRFRIKMSMEKQIIENVEKDLETIKEEVEHGIKP